MGKKPPQKTEEKLPADNEEAPGSDLADIDPAEFFDPEELGYERRRAHCL